MTAKKTLLKRIQIKMRRSTKRVFLRQDFKSLGGYDQVGRALKELTRQGKLIRLGYGIYAKARPNRLTGTTMIDADGGFEQAVK